MVVVIMLWPLYPRQRAPVPTEGMVMRIPEPVWKQTIADRDPNSGPSSHTDYATPVLRHNGTLCNSFKMPKRT